MRHWDFLESWICQVLCLAAKLIWFHQDESRKLWITVISNNWQIVDQQSKYSSDTLIVIAGGVITLHIVSPVRSDVENLTETLKLFVFVVAGEYLV